MKNMLEMNKSLEKNKALHEMVTKHEQKRIESQIVGERMAKSILENYPAKNRRDTAVTSFETSAVADILASMLIEMDEKETADGCFDLMLQWTFERYWGAKIEKLLPDFKQAYDWLQENNYTSDNSLSLGDADENVWIEPCEDKKVIVVKSNCTIRDDNVFIYILKESSIGYEFHARSAWSRTRRAANLKGIGWSYIEKASLAFYRKQRFNLYCGDFRDPDYCFSVKNMLGAYPQAEGAIAYVKDINSALWYLSCATLASKGEYE